MKLVRQFAIRKFSVLGQYSQKHDVMTKRQRAFFAYLLFLTAAYLLRYIVWWFSPQHIPNNFLSVPYHNLFNISLFATLSFIVYVTIIQRLGSWFALWQMRKPSFLKPQKHLRVAFLTCYVPGKEPVDMLENTLRAMKAARYPHDTWVLDEGNSQEVKKLCKRLGVKHFSRKGIQKYNQEAGLYRTKTKAGNHNAWRDKYDAKYDVVAQIDMDHVPTPEYFERTLGYFSDPEVGFIAMPQIYKNTDNWIAKGAAEQAFFFHGPMQKGYYGADMPFLIGTSHIYRVRAMNDIGGYAPTIVEDHLTGMHFFANGWKGVFVPEILAEGEGPTNWVDYFNQQMRWSYGLFEILFRHTPKLLGRLTWRQKINYFIAQLYYFTGVAVALGFVLTVLYLVFGIRAANMNIFAWLSYVTPVIVLSLLIQVYAHRFTIDPKQEPIFGFTGMFLNLGANIIYALAFVNFLVGKKMKYMVTQKGSTAQQQHVPISTFHLHIVIAMVMFASLSLSLLYHHDAIQLRFWALFNGFTLMAVALSTYISQVTKQLQAFLRGHQLVRYSLTFAMACIIMVGAMVLFAKRVEIANAVSANSRIVTIQPLSGKVLPSREAAFIGLSMQEDDDFEETLRVEQKIQKRFAVVGYYQAWGSSHNQFNATLAERISVQGSVPMITWEPWNPVSGYDRSEDAIKQPAYALSRITRGDYDGYIAQYAHDVRQYGKPVMIRFAHEMNGNWYSWGSTFNTPVEYIAAWRHVHDIFDRQGAKNVTWVWSPNETYIEDRVPHANDIMAFYPGDAYVDWVGFSSFNWANMYKANYWKSPAQMYDATLSVLHGIHKPIMIAETASADGGDPARKAAWIRDLAQYVKEHPEINGVVWFHAQDNGINWKINSEMLQTTFKNAFSGFAESLPTEK